MLLTPKSLLIPCRSLKKAPVDWLGSRQGNVATRWLFERKHKSSWMRLVKRCGELLTHIFLIHVAFFRKKTNHVGWDWASNTPWNNKNIRLFGIRISNFGLIFRGVRIYILGNYFGGVRISNYFLQIIFSGFDFAENTRFVFFLMSLPGANFVKNDLPFLFVLPCGRPRS